MTYQQIPQVLSLKSMLFGDPELFPHIYIRQCYLDLAKTILYGPNKNVLILGTPGIGQHLLVSTNMRIVSRTST